MKKKVLVDLITSHYENDSITFFNATLEVLKEMKEIGDDLLVNRIQEVILPHLKVVPARKEDKYMREMSKEEWEKYFKDNPFNLVPQEEHF